MDHRTRPKWSQAEKWAVENYVHVVQNLEYARGARRLSVRALAAEAGLSVSVTSSALTGSSWPRWRTLEALAGALGWFLHLDGVVGVDALSELELAVELEAKECGVSRATFARQVGLRPNTLYDLWKPGRSPSTSTVFLIAAWSRRWVDVRSRI